MHHLVLLLFLYVSIQSVIILTASIHSQIVEDHFLDDSINGARKQKFKIYPYVEKQDELKKEKDGKTSLLDTHLCKGKQVKFRCALMNGKMDLAMKIYMKLPDEDAKYTALDIIRSKGIATFFIGLSRANRVVFLSHSIKSCYAIVIQTLMRIVEPNIFGEFFHTKNAFQLNTRDWEWLLDTNLMKEDQIESVIRLAIPLHREVLQKATLQNPSIQRLLENELKREDLTNSTIIRAASASNNTDVKDEPTKDDQDALDLILFQDEDEWVDLQSEDQR